MFSATEPLSSEMQAEVKRRIYKLLKKSPDPEWVEAEGITPEQHKAENEQIAQFLAERYGRQLVGQYEILKALKKSGHKELCSLAGEIEYSTVTPEEVDMIYTRITTLLKEERPRAEIQENIKVALQPFIERNEKHREGRRQELQKRREQLRQERISLEQATAAAKQATAAAEKRADVAERKLAALKAQLELKEAQEKQPRSKTEAKESKMAFENSRMAKQDPNPLIFLRKNRNENKARSSTNTNDNHKRVFPESKDKKEESPPKRSK